MSGWLGAIAMTLGQAQAAPVPRIDPALLRQMETSGKPFECTGFQLGTETAARRPLAADLLRPAPRAPAAAATRLPTAAGRAARSD